MDTQERRQGPGMARDEGVPGGGAEGVLVRDFRNDPRPKGGGREGVQPPATKQAAGWLPPLPTIVFKWRSIEKSPERLLAGSAVAGLDPTDPGGGVPPDLREAVVLVDEGPGPRRADHKPPVRRPPDPRRSARGGGQISNPPFAKRHPVQ